VRICPCGEPQKGAQQCRVQRHQCCYSLVLFQHICAAHLQCLPVCILLRGATENSRAMQGTEATLLQRNTAVVSHLDADNEVAHLCLYRHRTQHRHYKDQGTQMQICATQSDLQCLPMCVELLQPHYQLCCCSLVLPQHSFVSPAVPSNVLSPVGSHKPPHGHADCRGSNTFTA
jgi:hypothetical protein